MTDLDIEIFLAIYRHKSFSKAAAQMFMSQSSISERLKALETTLGFALLQRSRGKQEMTLTPEGRTFYELAIQRHEITRKMLAAGKSRQTVTLRISCRNNIGDVLLPMAHHRFLQRYPQSNLMFFTMPVQFSYEKITNREIDLAFSTLGEQRGMVTSTPFLSEPLAFICSANSDYPDVVEPNMLSHKDEIYKRWSYDIERWHHSLFKIDSLPMIQTDLFRSTWSYFDDRPNTWSIVPRSVAADLCASLKIRQRRTEFFMPDRMIFTHTHYEDLQNENILLFLQCFREILQEQGTGLLL